MRILIVEDDPEMGRLLERGLVAEGYEVVAVANGVDALIAVDKEEFALAAIDVGLPHMSGFEVCRRIRDSGSTMPVLLLTARNAVEDRVFGLDSGADDYLTKPFAFVELAARIRALLRRDANGGKLSLSVGQLVLDSASLRVTVGERQVAMSPKEFALLRLLASRLNTTVGRVAILEEVWGSAENIDPNIVEQYVSYLRRKLDPLPSGVRITTVRGAGYKLELAE
ncbi:MAG TPA: response regulator transcription factor [Lacisediminihabitans sp.]|jgi:two-component system OmpR family response regulator|nr:response regulator transcription factor [Lacisediminihabitans sp.]HXD62746.1 response regulator transcription factor [Lacisediminihabitans sp.]